MMMALSDDMIVQPVNVLCMSFGTN